MILIQMEGKRWVEVERFPLCLCLKWARIILVSLSCYVRERNQLALALLAGGSLGISCVLQEIVLLCHMPDRMDQFLACSLRNGQGSTQPAAALGFQGREGSRRWPRGSGTAGIGSRQVELPSRDAGMDEPRCLSWLA